MEKEGGKGRRRGRNAGEKKGWGGRSGEGGEEGEVERRVKKRG